MSKINNNLIQEMIAILKGLPEDFIIPEGLSPEETMPILVQQIVENYQRSEREKAALSSIIAETSNQFQERVLDLSLVRRFGEELDILMDINEFYERLLNILIEEIGVENCSIMIMDKSNDELVLQAGSSRVSGHYKKPESPRRFKLGEGVAGHVAQTGEGILIDEVDKEPLFRPLPDMQVHVTSLLCIPFPTSGEVLGVLNLSHPDPKAFNENKKRILLMLANQIALAITNNSFLKAEQKASKNNMAWAISSLIETNRRLKTITEISRLISASLDLEETLNIILIKVVESLQAERASLLLIDEETKDLVVETAIGRNTESLPNTRLKSGESISGYVVETGKAILVKDIETDERFKRTNSPRYSTKSLISVPLFSKYRSIGVLNVSDKLNMGSFSDTDLELVTALAAQITIAIQNASMFEQKKKTVLELEILNDINDKVQRAKNISNAMEMIMDSVARITDYSFSLFYHWRGKKNTLALKHYRGLSKEEAKAYNLKFDPSFVESIIEDPSKLTSKPEAYFKQLFELPLVKAARFKKVIPLVVEDRFYGLLVIGKQDGRDYSAREMNLLQIIASQASAVFERSVSFMSASQLITLGEIMGSIVHDLKNPLTAIKGTIQLLQNREQDPVFVKKGLEIMSNSAYHLDELIDGYFSLTSSKLKNYQLQNPNEIIRKLEGAVRSRFRRYNIALKLNLEDDIPSSVMDYRQIYDALLNILVNALQAMERKGSEVSITTHCEHLPDFNDNIVIQIKDDGPCIPKKQQQKVFERFFTTREGSTGLGLFIVQQIIRNHSGSIEMESKLNEGTTITIKLPVRQERPITDFT